ncbi:MAG: hypothetical protein ACR650_00185 [Methylocystis sp.]
MTRDLLPTGEASARRGFLRTLALAPVAALATAAAAGANADPIIEALAEVKRLGEAGDRLYEELERAEIAAQKKLGPRPNSLVAWRDYSAIGGEEIDRARERYRKIYDPELIDSEYRYVKEREQARERAMIEWDARAGIAELRRQYALSTAGFIEARERLGMLPPSTPAGAVAVLIFIKNELEEDWLEPWQALAVDNLIGFLRCGGAAGL